MTGSLRASTWTLMFVGMLLRGVAAGSPVPPASPRLPVVAISELDSKGVVASEVGVIAENIAVKLQQSGKFRIMERSQISQILREQNFQQSGACDGSECAVQIGKLLGIDRIVVGSVGRVGSTYSLNLRMVDVSTGEAVRTTARNRKGSIDDVLTDLVPLAAADLAEVGGERKAAIWPWVAGGAVAVGGVGIAAAVLLVGGNSSSGAVPASDGMTQDHLKFTW